MSERLIQIHWARTAADALAEIGSRTIKQKLYEKVEELLRHEPPEAIGKPLQDELRGYYRIPFGRYRILYRVSRSGTMTDVEVVLVGLRKQGNKRDIYEIAHRLRRQGKI